jgi:DNA-directed RNA polymerase II subunit RPB2
MELYYKMSDQLAQVIIDKLFQDNPNLLVNHHLDSFNEFYNDGIKRIFREKNPIQIMKEQDPKTKEFGLRCNIFMAGKNGNKLYYGKPIIYDDDREHFMYPNEARLRNMTYGITIHIDVDVDFYIKSDKDEEAPKQPTYSTTLEKIFLGRFPIMLFSDLCILKNLASDVRFELGECRNDYGGYFIIDGKEKVIVSQEKFADNMLYVRDKVNDMYSHSAEIRSVSEDASKPIRTLSIRMVAPSPTCNNKHIVVNIPNVRKPVPLFILMRALGVESDKSIIEHCLLDMEKYSSYVDLFAPCIYDAGSIFTQQDALKYIAVFTKGKTTPHALEILSDYLLPHVGEMNFHEKAYYIGHMTKEMMRVYTKDVKPTDRDSFKYKRVELPGSLIYDLFKEYYTMQQREISQHFDKKYTYNKGLYRNKFTQLIEANYKEAFAKRIVETGFRKGFKGNWGAVEHTKRLGAVQGLNRLSYNAAISHLRKINLPLDASAKVIGPRLLHGSQWGIIDPVDTPDGGNVGLHKHMAISAAITTNCSGKPMIRWLKKNKLRLLEEGTPKQNGNFTKVLVNGAWIGVVKDPKTLISNFKKARRIAMLPVFSSIRWDIGNSSIYIFTDSGRMCRPVFYVQDNKKPSYDKPHILERINSGNFTWQQLTTGFAPKKDTMFNPRSCKIYNELSELYAVDNIEALEGSEAIIEYLDTAEAEGALVAFDGDDLNKKPYTHLEIHPSLILGVMGNQIIFPENNQLPRDLFACGQMRQAVSLYHSNFQTRIDKMGVVLNNGQTPLIKSRYLNKICKEQHPYGENVIAAIMVYGSYNVEDSILFNEGALKRGLFRTTYYNSYEAYEESSKIGNMQVDTVFTNIEKEDTVVGKKPGFDYSELDENGMVKENTPLTEKTVLIGRVTNDPLNPNVSRDASVVPKKGQLGFVDKTFVTEGEEGFRLAKVRVRHERVPNIGDKFCSRCGQKGTIGLVIPEEDMPFTSDGLKPDIIINPHAIPSRMTIGQLVETLMGKACTMYGGYGDCTAFMNKGQKATNFGKLLTNVGFHSSGNQILYNGMTGEQLQSQIFIGPTYYMRLKHMVKDKINYRARGPRTQLTRQTVQGRANNGGLRIGEMERDGVAGHGASYFLNESLMVRGDEYFMAVCNKTGMTAIYNESHNLFLSPYADGPIRFIGNMDDGMNIENISKYGRSFSVIRIPYAFKLLMQELQTMGVQMKIITEDNIDQLSSMAFSDNVVRLAGKDATPKSILSQAQNAARKSSKTGAFNTTPTKIGNDDTQSFISESKFNFDSPQAEYAHSPLPTRYEKTSAEREKESKNIDPNEKGWRFAGYDFETGDLFESLIINEDGNPSQVWYVEDHLSNPKDYPSGWKEYELVMPSGSIIPDEEVIRRLAIDKEPNNWDRVISAIKKQTVTPIYEEPVMSVGVDTYIPKQIMSPQMIQQTPSPEFGNFTPEYALYSNDIDKSKVMSGGSQPQSHAPVIININTESSNSDTPREKEVEKDNDDINPTVISSTITRVTDDEESRGILDVSKTSADGQLQKQEGEKAENDGSSENKKVVTFG